MGRVEEHEKFTVDLGSGLVLSALALGLQLGHWSPWTGLAALGVYLAWVVAYSEVTVQVAKRRGRPV